MTQARNHQLFFHQPTFFHLTSRCVRRAFLCGKDRVTGKRYDHRKRWLERQIFLLSKWFYIDIYGYAILSNHYHLVVRTRPDQGLSASEKDMATRWCRIFPRQDTDEVLRIQALLGNQEKLKLIRQRLSDISWLMRRLNEGLARTANREDRCNGRFWQGRFHSQLLLEEAAVLMCMVYVDLNPIRAGAAVGVEDSRYTSIFHRIHHTNPEERMGPVSACFESGFGLPLDLKLSQYVTLVERTGELFKAGAQTSIADTAVPVLRRLNIRTESYSRVIANLSKLFYRAIGNPGQLEEYSQALGQCWVKGRASAAMVFR